METEGKYYETVFRGRREEAYFVKGFLESCGLTVFLWDDVSSVDIYLSDVRGLRLVVPLAEKEKALRFMKEISF